MSLFEELDAVDKKGLFKSNDNIVCYPTGITVLDYANGYWTEVMGPNGKLIHVPNIGIPGGSMMSIIGATGNGKSTLAEQIGWNIIKKFPDGMMFIIDCEKSAERERITNLLGCDRDEPKIRIIKGKSSIDDVLESFDLLCTLKEEGKKKYMYEIKNRSYTGESFWTYVPTIYIIDSLPKFNSSEFNVKDIGGNIDGMRASKDTTRFYTNVIDRAWQYNVIFIVINHIRPSANLDPYSSSPRGLMMINPKTEMLPRGSVAQYYSSIYFRINSNKSSCYTVEKEGFTGFKCEIQLAKSRTNVVGTSFPVAFNSDRGFDPIYSVYEFAYSLGLVTGKNPYLKIKGFEEYPFNRKEFVNMMAVDKTFRDGVLSALRPYYESLLSSKQERVAANRNTVDLSYDDSYYETEEEEVIETKEVEEVTDEE